MQIVIIGHNEAKSIEAMIESLKQYPFKLIWVLDRCTDDSFNILSKYGEFIVLTDNKLQGRQTSYSRNLGLSYADKDEDVLFLDGDRFLVSGDLNTLVNSNFDIELLYLKNDIRNTESYKEYGKIINGFYSCGVFFKREVINKILNFQGGKLFNEDIQNYWGIEDTYLGDVCYHLGLTCNYNHNIRLSGGFSRLEVESTDIIRKRFELRDKLNVLWQ